jgi:hypothetical protein
MQAREALFGYIDQNLPADSGRSVRDAVGNYRQARHSEVLADKDVATGRLNTSKAAGPELSAEQTRGNIAKLLNSRTALRGFSDTERGVLESANTATPAINRAQRLGDALSLKNAAAGGVGAGALATLPSLLMSTPSATGVGVGAALATGGAAVGAGARSYANRGARRLASEADNAIRGMSPLAQEQFATLPSNFSATMRGPVSTPSGAMIAAAMDARQREMQQQQNAPQQYRVLPDGTVEEFL